MASFEICPYCGAETRVYIHTTSAGIAVLSGRCGHCSRLVGRRLTPDPEPVDQGEPGKLIGWTVKTWEEGRGWHARRYSIEEETLMQSHVQEYRETLTYYTIEEVRA